MPQNFLIGKCGRYIWAEHCGLSDWIFDEDYDSFIAQHNVGVIYHCVSADDFFISIMSSRDRVYRVRADGFEVVSYTSFYKGDVVRVLNGSRAGELALIGSIGWHMEKKKIIYSLVVDGRRSSRWYWEEDIAPPE